MYKVKYLQEELTSLFRTRILEDGNPAEDAMDYLGNIDFHALTQAVQDKARTAYTYITQGMQEKSFNYRGPELFGQKATLLYVEDDQSTMEIAVTTRTLELWLLEDMSLVCVACLRAVKREGGQQEGRALDGRSYYRQREFSRGQFERGQGFHLSPAADDRARPAH